MPEGDTDKFRESPTLSVGLKKPDPYPIREMIYVTSDEAYQFRQPNTAYGHPNTPAFELPDGLQSDGSQPRHWGDTPVSHEDNTEVNRHNPDLKASEQEKAEVSKFRGEAASRIADPNKKRSFIAEQGNLEAKGKLNRISQDRLKTDAALE